MEEEKNICEECSKTVSTNDLYVIYKILVISNLQCHFVGMKSLIDELNDYVMEKQYHLSSSQIILLRPDIVKEFLNKKYYPEEVMFWFMVESEICNGCFEKYKTLVPER